MTAVAEDARKRVRLSFDVSEELRRRVRHEAVNQDMTLTELLTRIVEERLAEPEEDREEKHD